MTAEFQYRSAVHAARYDKTRYNYLPLAKIVTAITPINVISAVLRDLIGEMTPS